MNEWLLIALVVAGIACGLFPIFLLLFRRPPDVLDDDDKETALGGLTEPLAAQLPVTASGGDEIRKLLLGAGYYHPGALTDFRAIRVALMLSPLFLAGAAALILPPERVRGVMIFGIIFALLGFSLPRVWLAFQRRARGQDITRSLPTAIDNLTLCLSAGQNPLAAFNTVAHEMSNSHPVLAQELAITAKQAELHTLETAVKQWSDRVQVPEVSNLSALLVQSERLGTDTAATLTELSTNFRLTARQRAESQANRTSFWMLFPSVFCFWVAAAIILIGPAYLEFFEYRQRMTPDLMMNPTTAIDRANNRRGVYPDGMGNEQTVPATISAAP